MTVDIVAGKHIAVMYDTVTETGFGPVFQGDDAGDRLQAFLKWLERDARSYTDAELEELAARFEENR